MFQSWETFLCFIISCRGKLSCAHCRAANSFWTGFHQNDEKLSAPTKRAVVPFHSNVSQFLHFLIACETNVFYNFYKKGITYAVKVCGNILTLPKTPRQSLYLFWAFFPEGERRKIIAHWRRDHWCNKVNVVKFMPCKFYPGNVILTERLKKSRDIW